MNYILDKVSTFNAIHFKHIYRELNVAIDRLSRWSLDKMNGQLLCKEICDGKLINTSVMNLF